MTWNVSMSVLQPEQGSSPGLRRWLDFLRESGAARASGAEGGGETGRARAVSATGVPAGSSRRPAPMQDTSLATAAGATIAASRTATSGASRLPPGRELGALEAHAAVGELQVRRATYGSLERVFSQSGSAGSAASAMETLQETARRLREAPAPASSALAATTAGRAPAAATTAGRAPTMATTAAMAAMVGDAARELARTSDRLETLRMQARAALRATVTRVDALAQEVTSIDRRADVRPRRNAADQVAGDAAAAQGRRDAAARELVRLSGAQVDASDDGTLRIHLGQRPLVDEQGAHAVRVADDAEQFEAAPPTRAADPSREPAGAPSRGQEGQLPDPEPADDESREPRATEQVVRSHSEAVARAMRDALARIDGIEAATQREAGEVPAPAGQPGSQVAEAVAANGAGRLRWAQGGAVTGVSGVLAGQLASVERLVPMAVHGLRQVQDRFVDSVRALAAPGGPLEGQDVEALLHPLIAPAGAAGPVAGSAPGAASPPAGLDRPASEPGGAPVDADPIDSALQTLAGLPAGLADLRGAAAQQLQGAQRRLDVLSVVDAVLAGGAPPPNAGGLVSAAIAAAADTTGRRQAAQSSQHLVSSLQAVNALTASLGTIARLALAVGPTPPIVSVTGGPQLVATPTGTVLGLSTAPTWAPASLSGDPTTQTPVPASVGPVVGSLGPGTPHEDAAAAPVGLWQPAAGVQVRMLSAPSGPVLAADPSADPSADLPANPPGSQAGPVPGWAGPGIPYQADVKIHSVATPASVATATLPAGAVLNSGRGFSLALVTHADSASPQVTSVTVGQGARLGQVAASINASGAPALARVEGLTTATGPAQRLVVTASDSGVGTRLALVDGLGSTRPSVLGATVTLQSGADSVLDVTWADGAVVRITASGTSLPGALPGADLALRGGSDRPTARIEVSADAPAAWRRLEALGTGAAAVLDGLAGRSALDAAASRALSTDTAIADLSSRIRAALGLGGDETAPGGGAALTPGGGAALTPGGGAALTPGGGAAATTGAPAGSLAGSRQPLPGLRLDHDGRVVLDREAFLRAYDEDCVGLETRMQSAARDLLAVARETTDPRTGTLPVRITGEQAFLSDYSGSSGGVDQRRHHRQDALAERTEAMQNLLVRLDQEQRWLGEQAP